MLSVDGSYQLSRGLGGQPMFVLTNGRPGHGAVLGAVHGSGGGPHGEEADLDLYNPVYEELSASRQGSEDESDCGRARGRHSGPASEDEFAEDELSVGEGEPAADPTADRPADRPGTATLASDHCRDLDSSDADDRRG